MKNRKILIAAAACLIVLIVGLSVPAVLKSNRYKQGLSYFQHGLYQEAIERFSGLEKYKDSSKYLDYSLLQQALQSQNWVKVGEIAARIPGFLEADTYKILADGYALFRNGDLRAAVEKLKEAGDVPDVAEAKFLEDRWKTSL